MFMWHEAMAKRGSSEIASCLSTFFKRYRTRAHAFVSYSDGCGGQNKNLTIIGLLSELHIAGIYEVVDNLYLERGHTFLQNDRDFAIIEKRKASMEVNVPRDWFDIVRESSITKPFQGVEMEQDEFFGYKEAIARTSRSSAITYIPNRSRTLTYQRSFFIRACRTWNVLPTELRTSHISLALFKTLLLQYYKKALNLYDADDIRTWRTICPRCNTARSFLCSPTCCF